MCVYVCVCVCVYVCVCARGCGNLVNRQGIVNIKVAIGDQSRACRPVVGMLQAV